MSAFGGKADVTRTSVEVRFNPLTLAHGLRLVGDTLRVAIAGLGLRAICLNARRRIDRIFVSS